MIIIGYNYIICLLNIENIFQKKKKRTKQALNKWNGRKFTFSNIRTELRHAYLYNQLSKYLKSLENFYAEGIPFSDIIFFKLWMVFLQRERKVT